jgi:hypothetical protein
MCCISFVGSLHFKIFFSFFLITFLSPHTALPINIHLPFPLSQIMSSLLSGMVLSFCTCWFHKMFTLPSRLVTTYCGTWSYQCSLSNFTPISLHMLKCS